MVQRRERLPGERVGVCFGGEVGWVVGWLGGWIIWKYNQLSPRLGLVEAWAELGNIYRLLGNKKFPGRNSAKIWLKGRTEHGKEH